MENKEYESAYIINDDVTFDNLINTTKVENLILVYPFQVTRNKVYLDSPSFDLFKTNTTLSLVTNSSLNKSNMNKFMLKRKTELLDIRSEFNIEFLNTDIPQIPLKKIIEESKTDIDISVLEPHFIIKQMRNKRYINTPFGKIYVSIDLCNYYLPSDIHSRKAILKLIEFEIDDFENERLVDRYHEVITIFKNEFQIEKSPYSKFDFGFIKLIKENTHE